MKKNQANTSESTTLWSKLTQRKGAKISLAVVALLMILSPKIVPVVGNVLSDSKIESTPPPPLDMTILEPGPFQEGITATGSLLARAQVELSPEVSGKITFMNIEEGTEVKAGDLLVKINDRDLQAELRGAQSELELLTRSEDPKRQLLEKGGATQEEYDVIQAQINSKRAEIEHIQANIQRTEIRGPFDGILGLRYVDQGAYVTPNTPISSIQDLSSVKVEFSIPERYSTSVKAGNAITYRVQGIDSLFRGEVYAVEPQIDVRSKTFAVRAQSPNPQGLLQPGAYAEVDLILNSQDNTLSVPNIALIPQGEGFKVYRYSGGRAIPTTVEAGVRDKEKTQILSGLQAQDTILLKGLSGKLISSILRPGRRSKSLNVFSILKRLIQHLRHSWPNTIIILRGDSHFCSKEFMDWAQNQEKIGFITGLSGNKVLHEKA